MPASNRPEKIAATPVVGNDEALLARWNRTFLTVQGSDSDKCRDLARIGDALATRLRAALADVARLEARPSRYEDLMAIEQLQVQVDHYRTGMTEARAALAAAVAERDLLETMVNFAAGNISTQPEWSTQHPEVVREWIRSEVLQHSARAGRNDEQQR